MRHFKRRLSDASAIALCLGVAALFVTVLLIPWKGWPW